MTRYERKQLDTAIKNIKAIIRKHEQSLLRTDADVEEMIGQLVAYVHYLCGVQNHEHRIRLAYWETAFQVYNFLRKTHQLERKVVGMKPSVLMPLIMELEYLKNPR